MDAATTCYLASASDPFVPFPIHSAVVEFYFSLRDAQACSYDPAFGSPEHSETHLRLTPMRVEEDHLSDARAGHRLPNVGPEGGESAGTERESAGEGEVLVGLPDRHGGEN
jgi:hypothetical protein